jgi:uncharacterized damage-inducible protein DinB
MSTTTQQDVLSHALDQAGLQVTKVLSGLTADEWNQRLGEGGMTPAETAEHLCEVYTAFKTMAEGGQHDWGTYKSGETTQGGTLALLKRLRDEACAIAVASENPETIKAAIDYIALHDCYHVGQVAHIRMATDPAWDPYSIYGG